jgi:hypothetical protein
VWILGARRPIRSSRKADEESQRSRHKFDYDWDQRSFVASGFLSVLLGPCMPCHGRFCALASYRKDEAAQPQRVRNLTRTCDQGVSIGPVIFPMDGASGPQKGGQLRLQLQQSVVPKNNAGFCSICVCAMRRFSSNDPSPYESSGRRGRPHNPSRLRSFIDHSKS